MSQVELDAKNADFWSELCGTTMAREHGITDRSPESLRRFDQTYLAFYPYLAGYVAGESLAGKAVLEIGLGYGTLGQMLAAAGSEYHGLDISSAPVAMMQYRLGLLGVPADRVIQGSALKIPHPDARFDFVYSIGCLHHTGDTAAAVRELYRVLRPGGKAIVMLYNRHSFRQIVEMPVKRLKNLLLRRRRDAGEMLRARYDARADGEAAPHVDFITRSEVRRAVFRQFQKVEIDVQNFDSYGQFGVVLVPRKLLLANVARLAGTDLYIVATK